MTKPREFLTCAACGELFKRSWKRQKFCSLECTLANRIDKSDPGGCWPWLGATNDVGYGQIRMRGAGAYVHRLVVNAPEGATVLHLCDNPICCNPAHLKVGTQAENLADMRRKGRGHLPPVGLRGRSARTAKFSSDLLSSAENDLRRGVPRKEVSERYGISRTHIARLEKGLVRY